MESIPADGQLGGRKRWWRVLLVGLLAVGNEPTSGGQPRGGLAPVSLFDPRLEPLRTASARWEVRQGPDRAVVDQVCLVPDVAGFFEAIAQWDRNHYFPILIEDGESTLRFLRAFHPARVIRPPEPAEPIPSGRSWAAALASVKSSWREPGAVRKSVSHSNRLATAACPPDSLGPTPPGVVLSHPDAPMLAGAVALAAGRFQPLVRFDSAARYAQTLTSDEFETFDRDLSGTVAAVVPEHLGLGDDCDFLTVAGDYPYRYRDAKGEDEAVDDALGRSPKNGTRWAYAGRILGDPASSVYRAMCSLFLQPESATMFNGYDEARPPWTDYSTRGPALRMSGLMSCSDHGGFRSGNVANWHEVFDPENQSGFLWINSHGSPTVFHLGTEEASTSDVPRTVPCAVVMIHSFSAADPNDPSTIAGRWLANGAFVYFGSMNEPFLQSFRTPRLVVDLIAEHLPLSAALRNTSIEAFSTPWRLFYLGDPLFRLKPRSPRGVPGSTDQIGSRTISTRVPPDETTAHWPIIGGPDLLPLSSPLSPAASTEATFRVIFDEAAAQAASSSVGPINPTVANTITDLSSLNRDGLTPASRRRYDSTLADLLYHTKRRGELRSTIESIPLGDRTPELGRWLDAIRSVDFAWLLTGDDFDRIVPAWTRIIGSDALADFQKQATTRVATLANDPDRRVAWASGLRQAIGNRPLPPEWKYLGAELKRVEAVILLDQKNALPTHPR